MALPNLAEDLAYVSPLCVVGEGICVAGSLLRVFIDFVRRGLCVWSLTHVQLPSEGASRSLQGCFQLAGMVGVACSWEVCSLQRQAGKAAICTTYVLAADLPMAADHARAKGPNAPRCGGVLAREHLQRPHPQSR